MPTPGPKPVTCAPAYQYSACSMYSSSEGIKSIIFLITGLSKDKGVLASQQSPVLPGPGLKIPKIPLEKNIIPFESVRVELQNLSNKMTLMILSPN